MAFVKKFVKKEAPKAAASYVRKKREEEIEVEEAEEVEEPEAEQEVADDYDSGPQEISAPAPRRTAPRPSAPSPSARRTFAGNAGNGGGEQKKALRLTGLFAGKREGCFSGKLRQEDAENLAALIQEAISTNQQVIFFLWENQQGPQFSLTANVSAPRPTNSFNRGGGGFRKRW
ncbi:MAG: hypothetical protein ACRCZI_02945 [Cetobacterium sp.]